MNVDTLTIGLIIDPVALVHITINVGELAEAMGPIVLPVALVAGPI